MPALSLFGLWVTTISWSIAFLIVVSFFLYSRRRKPVMPAIPSSRLKSFVVDFTFVWVLMALLVFYIVTISMSSVVLFALGNVFVEAFLIFYIMKSRKRSHQ